jgi:hypothetical protein
MKRRFMEAHMAFPLRQAASGTSVSEITRKNGRANGEPFGGFEPRTS